MVYIIGAILLVLADQITKALTVSQFRLYDSVTVIDGILNFTRHHNTGGPWSIFDNHIIIFIIVTFLIFALELWYFRKKPMQGCLEKTSVMMINAGAVGNLIDRIFRGYVVDMIEVTFIDYPVFNLADCLIVVGCILLCIYVIFFDSDKKEKIKSEELDDGKDNTCV